MARQRLLLAGLASGVIALYLPTLSGPFQFDDWNVIVGDARVQSLAAWWDSMPGIRPLLKLSYALNAEAAGKVAAPGAALAAGGFRVVNLLLHAINVILVALLVTRLMATLRGPAVSGATATAWCAVVVFALHPLQSESVAYVSSRSQLLMATFALLAVVCWQRAVAAHARTWQLASVTSLVLACAVRETAIVLPLALWLLHGVTQADGAALPAAAAPRHAPRPWPQTFVALAVLASLAAMPVYRALLEFSLRLRDPLDNLLLAQPGAIVYLLGQLWRFDRLNVDPMLAAPAGWDAGVLRDLLLVGGLLIAGLANLRRRPWLALGLLWLFVWLAPTNSLIARSDLVNDRQWYLAIIGPAWLLGAALGALAARLRRPGLAPAALLLLAGLLAAATWQRNDIHVDEVAFWRDVAAKASHNPRAHNNLGLALAQRCDPDAARAEFRRALAIDRDYYLAAGNLALLDSGYFCTQAPASF